MQKLFILLWALISFNAMAQKNISRSKHNYDIVILNGRVVDPESKFDAVRNIGIIKGTIQTISTKALKGRVTINAKGLVVAPGFIDLHQHGQDVENYAVKVMDGVTTALELETGTADIDHWYAVREGKTPINYGVSVGHMPLRMKVMKDSGKSVPLGNAANRIASETELEQLKQQIEFGLKRGAVAVGFIIQFTPAASRWEIIESFRVAERFNARCHVHIRFDDEREPNNNIQALEEVIAAAAVTGASLHVVHIHSMGGRSTPLLLEMIRDAQSNKMDISTEMYPYTAWMTEIESTTFDEGWQERYGMHYKDLQWAATGERLTIESFEKYRKQGGLVIGHQFSEDLVKETIANSLTMIASDGELENGKGHPRTAGTYSKVIGHYVRETKTLTLMDALRKMALMPAQRLEQRVPMMKNKGRIRVGADADITIFDAERIIDKSTYEEPAKYSEGIMYVLVNGVLVVNNRQLKREIAPGKPVRAPIKSRD
ncbi:MAG: amidohydrolase family protein [Chitinophagaceae bacterium]